MSEKNRKKLVYAIFVVAIIWGIINFTGRSRDKAQMPQPANTPAVEQVNIPVTRIPTPISADVIKEYNNRSWGKDPFYHGYEPETTAKTPAEIQLRLLGVLYRKVNPQALINNQVVSVGDIMEGYKVTEITKNYVALDNGRKTIKLKVKKESS